AGDVNGDGFVYLVDWEGDSATTILLEDQGAVKQTIAQRKGWDGTIKGSLSIVGAGDLNGDGRADRVALDEGGQAVLFSQFNERTGFQTDARLDTSGA